MLSSVLYHDARDAWSKNEHRRNVQIIKELLYYHKQMLIEFIGRDSISKEDIHELLHRFNKIDVPLTAILEFLLPVSGIATDCRDEVREGSVNRIPLNDEVINLIVQCANEAHLFKELISVEHFTAYYSGKPLPAPRAAKNTNVVYFFSFLASRGLIQHNWQQIISEQKLIISASGKRFLNSTTMASTLCRVMNGPATADTSRIEILLNERISAYLKRNITTSDVKC